MACVHGRVHLDVPSRVIVRVRLHVMTVSVSVFMSMIVSVSVPVSSVLVRVRARVHGGDRRRVGPRVNVCARVRDHFHPLYIHVSSLKIR